MAHFRWSFKSGDKTKGSASFLEDACRFGMAPVIWAGVRPVGDGFELNLWGIRLGDQPDYGSKCSQHKSWSKAHDAAEKYADEVRKRFLQQKLAALDAERAAIMSYIGASL